MWDYKCKEIFFKKENKVADKEIIWNNTQLNTRLWGTEDSSIGIESKRRLGLDREYFLGNGSWACLSGE